VLARARCGIPRTGAAVRPLGVPRGGSVLPPRPRRGIELFLVLDQGPVSTRLVWSGSCLAIFCNKLCYIQFFIFLNILNNTSD
jgi:hypothetical protein